jgi:hypothetical protein
MGESAAHGGDFLDGGHKTVFPPGYPALLAVLLRLSFAHPWVIVGLNLVFLSAGLIATYSLLIREFFEDKSEVLIICSFFLLSYLVVKHFTIPLSDVPFFGLSMCCLATMSHARNTDSSARFVIFAVAAWLSAVAAITLRRVGVALIPPLVFMIVRSSQFKLMLKRLSLSAKLIVVVLFVFASVGTLYVVAKTATLSDFIGVARNVNMSELVLRTLSYRLTELGELFGNFPLSKTPPKLQVIMPWIGLLLLLVTLFGLATKRTKISPTEVFLVCYMGVLIAWPFRDARFWLPVIPLLIAYTLLGAKRLRFPKTVITMYCIAYATLGFGVIAYSTRITFSGCEFPDRYGDGTLKPTYYAAFESCPGRGDPNKVDAKVLRLLQEYK